MKKFIVGMIVGIMLTSSIAFAVSYVAEPVSFKVLVNGEEFVSEPPALVVEGRTYLPLRAIGDALGVPVEWNEELRQAEVGTMPAIENEELVISYYDEYNSVPDFGKIFNAEELSGNLPLVGNDWRIYKYAEEAGRDGVLIRYVEVLEKEGFKYRELSDDTKIAYMKNNTAVVLSADETYFEIMVMEK